MEIYLALCHACSILNPWFLSPEASKLGFRALEQRDCVKPAREKGWEDGDRVMTKYSLFWGPGRP